MHVAGPRAIRTRRHPQIGPDAIRCVSLMDADAEDVDRALDAFREITSGG